MVFGNMDEAYSADRIPCYPGEAFGVEEVPRHNFVFPVSLLDLFPLVSVVDICKVDKPIQHVA